MPPGAPPLPSDYVNPEEFRAAYDAWLASLYAYTYAQPYTNVSDFAWDSFATQPNWVEINPQITLPEVVVTGTRPVSPIETPTYVEVPRDAEGYTYNPTTGIPYPPTWQMNDEEYATFLGGGDAAYDQMWEERHPGEDPDPLPPADESFVLPITLLYPAVGTLATLGTVLLGGLGALLLPTPTAPRELDEAPTPPKPPRRTPTPQAEPDDRIPFLWPSVPEFTEPGPFPFALPVPRPGDMLDQWRPVLPISDDPGLFDDPLGLPEFPEPEPFPSPDVRPRPAPRPSPTGSPIESPWTAFPDVYADPWRIALPQPDVPTRLEPWLDTPVDPFVATPTIPGTPLLPGLPLPGAPFDPFTPNDPARDPFDLLQDQPQPQNADSCDCTKVKKKKKKNKSQPRQICYEGHYVEHSRGLTKVRGKQIPCDTKKARSPRARTPSLPDLARDVFQLPGV